MAAIWRLHCTFVCTFVCALCWFCLVILTQRQTNRRTDSNSSTHSLAQVEFSINQSRRIQQLALMSDRDRSFTCLAWIIDFISVFLNDIKNNEENQENFVYCDIVSKCKRILICVGEHLLITFSAFVLSALIFGIVCEIAKRRNESEYVWLRNICVDGRKKNSNNVIALSATITIVNNNQNKNQNLSWKKRTKNANAFFASFVRKCVLCVRNV